jgi:hypothetical protein
LQSDTSEKLGENRLAPLNIVFLDWSRKEIRRFRELPMKGISGQHLPLWQRKVAVSGSLVSRYAFFSLWGCPMLLLWQSLAPGSRRFQPSCIRLATTYNMPFALGR